MITKIGWGFGRCNQFCRHCYNASTMQAPAHPLSVLAAVADKVCPRITDINYGTGEFIVNPNALALARYIADRYPRVAQAVTSNGSTIMLMRPDDIRRLFHDVDISLDFPSPDRHNAFRGHPKAWEWAVGALRKLQELSVPRTLVTCVTSLTSDEDVRQLLSLAHRYGALWRINWFRRTGRGDSTLRVSAARAWEIIRLVSERSAIATIDPIFGAVLDTDCKPCPAGHYTCRFHENLDVSPYPFLKGHRWNSGNIADPAITLATIYRSPVFTELRERTVPTCTGCPFFERCRSGCTSRAILHNSITEPDDYCPVKARLDIDTLRTITIRRAPETPLVHDGYLCTTIVRPLQEEI